MIEFLSKSKMKNNVHKVLMYFLFLSLDFVSQIKTFFFPLLVCWQSTIMVWSMKMKSCGLFFFSMLKCVSACVCINRCVFYFGVSGRLMMLHRLHSRRLCLLLIEFTDRPKIEEDERLPSMLVVTFKWPSVLECVREHGSVFVQTLKTTFG